MNRKVSRVVAVTTTIAKISAALAARGAAKVTFLVLAGVVAFGQVHLAVGQPGKFPPGVGGATVQLFSFSTGKPISEIVSLTTLKGKDARRTCGKTTQFSYEGSATINNSALSVEGGTLTSDCKLRFALVATYTIRQPGNNIQTVSFQGELFPEFLENPDGSYMGRLIEQTGNKDVAPLFFLEIKGFRFKNG